MMASDYIPVEMIHHHCWNELLTVGSVTAVHTITEITEPHSQMGFNKLSEHSQDTDLQFKYIKHQIIVTVNFLDHWITSTLICTEFQNI